MLDSGCAMRGAGTDSLLYRLTDSPVCLHIALIMVTVIASGCMTVGPQHQSPSDDGHDARRGPDIRARARQGDVGTAHTRARPTITRHKVMPTASSARSRIARILEGDATGSGTRLSERSWAQAGLTPATGKSYKDLRSYSARMREVTIAAWEESGARRLTGTEYDDHKDDRSRVLALGKETVCKHSRGKSLCAFPDVCHTPGEGHRIVPIPYPNTGEAKDTSRGSKKTKSDVSPLKTLKTGKRAVHTQQKHAPRHRVEPRYYTKRLRHLLAELLEN